MISMITFKKDKKVKKKEKRLKTLLVQSTIQSLRRKKMKILIIKRKLLINHNECDKY